MMDHLEAEIRRLFLEQAAALERACEEALQGGQHGVLVVRDRFGGMKVAVDPSVPYGHIYEVDAPEAGS